MTDSTESPASRSDKQNNQPVTNSVSWGPKLFIGVFVALLVFFWWLLIYSHGVAPHHG